jgi:hypothetical protein
MNGVVRFTFTDAIEQMGQCDFGHKRRTTRLVDTATRISEHPDGSLPDKLHDPAAYRATLRLMNLPVVTHQAILQPHCQETLRRISATPRTILNIHDTTELDYSGLMAGEVMGQIGNGGGRGYECHNSLAVDAESGELLGLLYQQLHKRIDKPAGEGVAASRERESRESLLWVNAVNAIGDAPEGCHWIDVCDRGADTFEFLEYERKHNRHFVIRSKHSRALEVESEEGPHLLHDLLRSLEAQVGWKVKVSANKGQAARTAKVLCCWAEVTIKAPHVRRGKHGRKSLKVWALRVWEVEAPPEVNEPLEWLLLTDEAIADAGEARQRVGYYERRPRVEEFHKGQKTGMGIENLQLQSRAGIEPLIALLSVLAVALVNAREAARQPETAERPATEYFDPLLVFVLSLWRYKEERRMTVREFILAVARLGGHQNRKCDGLPGWITLWRGMSKLHYMLEYELARRSYGKL